MRAMILAIAIAAISAIAAIAAAGAVHAQGIGQTIKDSFKDSALAAAVGVRIQYNKTLLLERIDIDAKDGVVTLSGNMSSEEKIRTAVDIARNTQGVRLVINELQVGPSKPPGPDDPFKAP